MFQYIKKLHPDKKQGEDKEATQQIENSTVADGKTPVKGTQGERKFESIESSMWDEYITAKPDMDNQFLEQQTGNSGKKGAYDFYAYNNQYSNDAQNQKMQSRYKKNNNKISESRKRLYGNNLRSVMIVLFVLLNTLSANFLRIIFPELILRIFPKPNADVSDNEVVSEFILTSLNSAAFHWTSIILIAASLIPLILVVIVYNSRKTYNNNNKYYLDHMTFKNKLMNSSHKMLDKIINANNKATSLLLIKSYKNGNNNEAHGGIDRPEKNNSTVDMVNQWFSRRFNGRNNDAGNFNNLLVGGLIFFVNAFSGFAEGLSMSILLLLVLPRMFQTGDKTDRILFNFHTYLLLLYFGIFSISKSLYGAVINSNNIRRRGVSNLRLIVTKIVYVLGFGIHIGAAVLIVTSIVNNNNKSTNTVMDVVIAQCLLMLVFIPMSGRQVVKMLFMRYHHIYYHDFVDNNIDVKQLIDKCNLHEPVNNQLNCTGKNLDSNRAILTKSKNHPAIDGYEKAVSYIYKFRQSINQQKFSSNYYYYNLVYLLFKTAVIIGSILIIWNMHYKMPFREFFIQFNDLFITDTPNGAMEEPVSGIVDAASRYSLTGDIFAQPTYVIAIVAMGSMLFLVLGIQVCISLCIQRIGVALPLFTSIICTTTMLLYEDTSSVLRGMNEPMVIVTMFLLFFSSPILNRHIFRGNTIPNVLYSNVCYISGYVLPGSFADLGLLINRRKTTKDTKLIRLQNGNILIGSMRANQELQRQQTESQGTLLLLNHQQNQHLQQTEHVEAANINGIEEDMLVDINGDKVYLDTVIGGRFIERREPSKKRKDSIGSAFIELDDVYGIFNRVNENLNYSEIENKPATTEESETDSNIITGGNDGSDDTDDMSRIFICTTCWHENKEEFSSLINSFLRVDRVVGAINDSYVEMATLFANPGTTTSTDEPQAHDEHNSNHSRTRPMRSYGEDIYYEIHVFFDDAILHLDNGVEEYNEYVCLFLDQLPISYGNQEGQDEVVCELKTPYGYQLRIILPHGLLVYVHLKDITKVRAKKRWSQIMYLNYLLKYRFVKEQFHDLSKVYILTTDGDVSFDYASLLDLWIYLDRNGIVGGACSRIFPVSGNSLSANSSIDRAMIGSIIQKFQSFEYALGHWLQKSAEHVLGSVLCLPGCFSLFRGSALAEITNIYSGNAVSGADFLQMDQGEDRWMCTLLLKKGWVLQYAGSADAYTYCPGTFDELYNQRRRWITSTIANIGDLILDWSKVVDTNIGISRLFLAYQFMMLLGTVISPVVITLMISAGLNAGYNVNSATSLIVLAVISVLYVLIAMFTDKKYSLATARYISLLAGFAMVFVITGFIVGVITKPASVSSVFIYIIVLSILISGIFHIREFYCLYSGVIYLMAMPSAFVMLLIYSVSQIDNVSWGTRENLNKSSSKDEASADVVNTTNKMDTQAQSKYDKIKAKNSAKLNILKDKIFFWKRIQNLAEEEELLVDDRQQDNSNNMASDTDNGDVEQFIYGEEFEDAYMEPSVIYPLETEESEFWDVLIAKTLLPEAMEKNHTEKKADLFAKLIRLRSTSMWALLAINAIVAIVFLGVEQSVELMLYDMNILTLVLTVFTLLCIFQFVAMMCHSWFVLMHIIATSVIYTRNKYTNNLQKMKRKRFLVKYFNKDPEHVV